VALVWKTATFYTCKSTMDRIRWINTTF